MTAEAVRPTAEPRGSDTREARPALPDPDSAAWRERMGDALTAGNVGAMADLLLAGIAQPAAPEPRR